MAKEAASRTLDYKLSGDVLDRLSDAERSKYFDTEGEYRGSGGVGKGIDKIVGAAKERRKEFATAEKKAEEERKLEQEKRDQGEVNFDNSFSELGERGSWTTPYMHDLFTQNEMTKKDAYLDALEKGDKVLANRLLNEQNTRYSSITGWKEAVNGAQAIFDGTKDPTEYVGQFSQSLLDDPAAMHVIGKINDSGQGSGVKINTDENNEVYYTIPAYDPATGGDHPTERKTITLKDYQKLTNQTVDDAFTGVWSNEITTLYKGASNGEITKFDFDSENSKNAKRITQDNIIGYYKDDVFNLGRSFIDDLITNPEMIQGSPGWDFTPDKLSLMMETKKKTLFLDGYEFDADGDTEGGVPDGYLDHEEIVNMSENDKRKLVKHILLAKNKNGELVNFEIAQKYLSEWMTMMQDQNFQKGKDNPSQRKYNVKK